MGMLKIIKSGASCSRSPESRRRWPASMVDLGIVIDVNEGTVVAGLLNTSH